jgi:hypothetical protein
MFDKALREKFHENPGDDAVRQQAIKLLQLFRGSLSHEQVLVDDCTCGESVWTYFQGADSGDRFCYGFAVRI